MGLRWSIPLPGPFRVSGNVFSGKATRSLRRAGRKLAQAATQPAPPAEPVDYSADVAAARERARRHDEAAERQAQYRAERKADKAAGHGPFDRVMAPTKMRQHREWARRQHLNGMPASAGQYERMCDELRAMWPDIAAELDAKDWDDALWDAQVLASSPEQQAREANARVKAGLSKAAGSFDAVRRRLEQDDGRSLTRAEVRSLFGERRR